MYVYIYIYIHIHIYICICMYIYIYIYYRWLLNHIVHMIWPLLRCCILFMLTHTELSFEGGMKFSCGIGGGEGWWVVSACADGWVWLWVRGSGGGGVAWTGQGSGGRGLDWVAGKQ